MTQTGRVKWFDASLGYGFLVPDDGGADVFVHHLNVADAGLGQLVAGDRLAFDMGVNTRNQRPKAINLRRAE
jgi:cold shock protein